MLVGAHSILHTDHFDDMLCLLPFALRYAASSSFALFFIILPRQRTECRCLSPRPGKARDVQCPPAAMAAVRASAEEAR